MSNLTKLEFVTLDISEKNYLSWILDAEIHLDATNLGDTIKEGNQGSRQNVLRNHQSRPTSSISFPEVNDTRFTPFSKVNGASFQRNRGLGRGRKNYRNENGCHRYGMIRHWSRICRTVKHLVDLYQVSIKEKIKKFETNFAEPSDALVSVDGEDITSLDVSYFFEDSSGRFDHLIDDESVPF
ncbi:hypothetical protein I3760_01G155600 [Carya illinoinensis]|nr:hypothetical protein I3760_01G155600 [Carya illinoinensis]